ncbi:MAG: 1-deoxy-D-xylulose-5-phosphate synthase [Litorivicinaceae bacterium]|nr:1-deoxy-D-xylulose-5-phosphate synthase [Litorivicinaceae bacterium]
MKLFHTIPGERPSIPLLEGINSPNDLRSLHREQLRQVADEVREYLLYSVGISGGHFGAGLGVVELTVALHFCLDTPFDQLVWDVGHQAYPHKVLTGRREQLSTIRKEGGLAAFPDRKESPYDTFGVGHSSTSISAALGMAMDAKINQSSRRHVAVIGDGALTAGLAFEALNHAASEKANLLVILNDNDMSISRNVGGIRDYLAKLLSSKAYTRSRDEARKLLEPLPPLAQFAKKTEEHLKGMVSPATLFEEIGFNYIGPIDGHDITGLVTTLQNMKDLPGPQFLHVVTQKGCGFVPAEDDPIKYHAIGKLKAKSDSEATPKPTYSNIFGQWLCDMAEQDSRLVGITPAMREGSDLIEFSNRFPDRYYDVAIAEQHAVCLGAGLATQTSKPVIAIYSTFLQRAYDQVIHDVCVQGLDVTFAIDRAGLVGEDGPTHAGVYDYAYLRTLPEIIIAAPSSEAECRLLLSTCYQHPGPAAVRYPRGQGPGEYPDGSLNTVDVGKAVVRREGQSGIVILGFGSRVFAALEAGDTLDATVIDMRWVKPLDEETLRQHADAKLIITVEEHQRMGGAGSAVGEFYVDQGFSVALLSLGLPDRFEAHGKPEAMLERVGLDARGITAAIVDRLS